MNKFDQIVKIDRILKSRRRTSMARLCEQLECSESTVHRRLREMKRQLNAPICSDSGNGWFYDIRKNFELPGLWFTHTELTALLAMRQLAGRLGKGLFAREQTVLTKRLDAMLSGRLPAAGDLARIRILEMSRQSRDLPHFASVAEAVLTQKRLAIVYRARSKNVTSEREISPQRLVHYRDNWYLDAFCHQAEEVRTFAVECLERVAPATGVCRTLPEEKLAPLLESSYGIFSGLADKLAVLRFTPYAARWVADEAWHPEQQGDWLPDGRFELRIPYADPTELLMEISRHGPEVEVVAPPELRSEVAERQRQAAAQYDSATTVRF